MTDIDWTDKKQVMAVVSRRGYDIQWASDALKDDEEVVMQAVSQDSVVGSRGLYINEHYDCVGEKCDCLDFVPKRMKNNVNVMREAVTRYDYDTLEEEATPWVQDYLKKEFKKFTLGEKTKGKVLEAFDVELVIKDNYQNILQGPTINSDGTVSVDEKWLRAVANSYDHEIQIKHGDIYSDWEDE